MNPFIVKQATIEDLEEVISLFNEYRIFYKQESDLEGARCFLFDRFEHRESVIFLVKESESNKPVGFTQLYPLFSSVSMKRSWILNDLYVVDEYRSRGIAQLLLDSAKIYAKQTKAKGLGLSTSNDNDRAQKYTNEMDIKKITNFCITI
ncbi:GNAT family N-acetyltransferase [Paenibacillus pini]|uniref:GNAT family N-acetyltransferase n=1 Tax=Paenibacillus pini TaxID=669461 RepID=UPI000A46E00E|nr:GNAT family N-acetyltransferase [Paenibacillus pini]